MVTLSIVTFMLIMLVGIVLFFVFESFMYELQEGLWGDALVSITVIGAGLGFITLMMYVVTSYAKSNGF